MDRKNIGHAEDMSAAQKQREKTSTQRGNKGLALSSRSAKNPGNPASESAPPEPVTLGTQAAIHKQPDSLRSNTHHTAMNPINNDNQNPFGSTPDTGVSKRVKEVLNGLLQSGIIERIRNNPPTGENSVSNGQRPSHNRARYSWIGRQPSDDDSEESSEDGEDADREQTPHENSEHDSGDEEPHDTDSRRAEGHEGPDKNIADLPSLAAVSYPTHTRNRSSGKENNDGT